VTFDELQQRLAQAAGLMVVQRAA